MRSGVTPGCFSTGAEVYGGDAMCEGVGSGVGGDPVSGVGVAVGGGELVPEPASLEPASLEPASLEPASLEPAAPHHTP
jgi:hypothetical protein